MKSIVTLRHPQRNQPRTVTVCIKCLGLYSNPVTRQRGWQRFCYTFLLTKNLAWGWEYRGRWILVLQFDSLIYVDVQFTGAPVEVHVLETWFERKGVSLQNDLAQALSWTLSLSVHYKNFYNLRIMCDFCPS